MRAYSPLHCLSNGHPTHNELSQPFFSLWSLHFLSCFSFDHGKFMATHGPELLTEQTSNKFTTALQSMNFPRNYSLFGHIILLSCFSSDHGKFMATHGTWTLDKHQTNSLQHCNPWVFPDIIACLLASNEPFFSLWSHLSSFLLSFDCVLLALRLWRFFVHTRLIRRLHSKEKELNQR